MRHRRRAGPVCRARAARTRGQHLLRLLLVTAAVAVACWWVLGLEDDDAVQWCQDAARVVHDDPGRGDAVTAQYPTRCP